MSKRRYSQQIREKGFTIVELMIALSVLSVLLLMSSALLISIGKMYSKGVNMANIQSASRNIMSDISSSMQFGPKPVFNPGYPSPYTAYTAGGKTVNVYSMCFDTKRYSFVAGQQISGNPDYTLTPPQTYHAIWEDTMQTNASCVPMNITQLSPTPGLGEPSVANSGRELLPLHSRLSTLSVLENPVGSGIYQVGLGIVYGDNDLLDATGKLCKGDIGQEYCASSNLNTVVTRRLK